jgi:hypothetical protein
VVRLDPTSARRYERVSPSHGSVVPVSNSAGLIAPRTGVGLGPQLGVGARPPLCLSFERSCSDSNSAEIVELWRTVAVDESEKPTCAARSPPMRHECGRARRSGHVFGLGANQPRRAGRRSHAQCSQSSRSGVA